jgi:hypothetical protein
MPNATFKPAVGDKYAVFGMSLPDAYVCDNISKTGASWDMFKEAAKYYYEHEEQQFSFAGELDPIYTKIKWLEIGGKIRPGGYVAFSDAQFTGALTRIVNVKHFINNPYSPQTELSNAPIGGSVSSELKKIGANEVVTEKLHKEAISYTKRRYRDAQETMRMIEAAFSNFSGSVNPITVQTMALLVGDESLQYRFVDDMATPATVAHNIAFNATTKVLSSPAGIIQHMTLGIKTISSSHAATEYKYWNVALYNSPALNEADKSYYLYAKCSKSTQTGIFLLSETPIAIESVAGYYHLLVGILNMENEDGDRSYVDLYGYSEILPGRITTEKITSPDGSTFIDFINKIIQGKFSFQAGSTGYGNLSDKPDLSHFAEQSFVEATKSSLQAQIDGQVIAWFKEYNPTTSNLPASGWNTDALKLQHANDTFTNTLTGGCWRWQQSGGVWGWGVIADTATQQALVAAGKAQDTADSKRRVFTAQPTTPYDIGDLWTGGPSGDLMKCKVSRLSGVYNSADWEKAAKYTDDTVANNIQVGVRNLIRYGDKVYTGVTDAYGGYNIDPWHTLSQELVIGQKYTISWKQLSGAVPDSVTLRNSSGTWLQSATISSGSSFVCNVSGAVKLYFYSSSKNAAFSFSRFKLEKGNKATDFTIAEEDVNASIAAAIAKAAEADYIKQAMLNNTTDVLGGMVLTALIRLGAVNQAGTWVEKAGINGLAGDDRTPRVWAGGTFAEAIARANDDINGAKAVITEGGKIYGRDCELYGNFATAHDGARIELNHWSKSVIIYDENNVPKTIISSAAIPSLESLLAGNSAEVAATKSASATAIESNVTDTQYSADLVLPATSGNYTITTPPVICNCQASLETEPPYRASCWVNVYLVLPDNSQISLGGITANTGSNTSASLTIPSKQFAGMPAGTYKIKLVANAFATAMADASASAQIVAPNNIFIGESVVEVSQIFRDGWFIIKDATHFHYFSPTREVVKNDEIKGFGVLVVARISDTGIITNMFNSLASVTSLGGGLYTITHNLGNLNYGDQIAPESTGNASSSIESRGENSCNVRLRLSGTGTNMPFQLVLFGKA